MNKKIERVTDAVKKEFYGNADVIKKLFPENIDVIKEELPEYFDTIKKESPEYFNAMKEQLPEYINAIKEEFNKCYNPSKDILHFDIDAIKEILQKDHYPRKKMLQKHIDVMKEILLKYLDAIKEELCQHLGAIKEELCQHFDAMKNNLLENIDTVSEELPEYIDTVSEELPEYIDTVSEELPECTDAMNNEYIDAMMEELSENKVKRGELNIGSIKLKKINKINSCAFGKVYSGIDDTGKILAVKCIKTVNIDNNLELKNAVKNFKLEISLFETLNHERIVKYYGATYSNTKISIVMEFMEGGSLYDKISNEGALDEITASEKSHQILEGLAYLHNQNIVHRDIKSANVLLDLYGNCKLSDFGISKQIQTFCSRAGCKTFTGTCYWMSPEVINASIYEIEYGKKADIWSFGCTVLEMLTTKPPWHNLNDVAAILQIFQSSTMPYLPDNLSNSCKTFLNDCFQRDPKLRQNALNLLTYDWVKRIA